MPFITKKKLKKIQAMAAEGSQNPVTLESLLTGIPLTESGTDRAYRTYSSQVSATYRKYNGQDELGNAQTRSLIDLRRAVIAGEGLSVQAKNPNTSKWINDFLNNNRLKGSKFFNWVQAGEMTGKALINIIPDRQTNFVRAYHYPYTNGKTGIDYHIGLSNKYDFDCVEDVTKKIGSNCESMKLKNFRYVKLGGDDTDVNETTTKVGLCLHEIESYDRAMNGVRKNNHLFSRITPTFKTQSQNETSTLQSWIAAVKWKIGMIFAGTAELKYIGPPTTAHDNYKTEMSLAIKIIAAVTGIPVHWAGWVDLMSNRATAEELYDFINNATIIERTIWAEAAKDIIIKSMQISIDSGFESKKIKGTDALLQTVDKDFEVEIPVMSWSKFKLYVDALLAAFDKKVISKKDVQNKMPGIDPFVTNQELEKEAKAEAEIVAKAIEDSITEPENPEEKPDDKKKENTID